MTDNNNEKYERKEVVVMSGNNGLQSIYFSNSTSDKVVYSRNAKIFGAIIAILLILAVVIATLSMIKFYP